MNDRISLSASLSLLEDNVVPTRLRVSATSVPNLSGFSSFDPDAVVLHKATGGFNSVTEMSADFCRRVFNTDLSLQDFELSISAGSLRAFLNSQDTPFVSNYLNVLKKFSDRIGDYILRVVFNPLHLRFIDPHRVEITYRGYVILQAAQAVVAANQEELLMQFLRQQDSAPLADLSSLADVVSFGGSDSSKGVGKGPNPAKTVSSLIQGQLEPAPIHELGAFDLKIDCEYTFETDDALKRVDVFAEVGSGKLTIEGPDGDAKRFYGNFLGADEAALKQNVLNTPQVHLTPTVSLVGRDPGEIDVTEITDFNVEVFHLGKEPSQALALAFNLRPGCSGIIEEVEYFIGDQDYGVISDEYLVERLFKHKWRVGGFSRTIESEFPVKLTHKNGSVEDVVLKGSISLNTLDVVLIDTDANDRRDGIVSLGGTSTVVPLNLIKVDGTVLDPNKAGLGVVKDQPWLALTHVDIADDLSVNASVKTFQVRARDDAYQHMAKPFARFTQGEGLSVQYARTEGVTRHVFFLANVESAFV